MVKNLPVNAGDGHKRDRDLIPGLGRSPGVGNGNPLQFSCMGNPTDRGVWQATVERVTKSWTKQHRDAWGFIDHAVYGLSGCGLGA